ncbi:MAG: T9SS type A sorting domain-containing protein [Ignavibacteriaceae bacterium]
MNKSFYFLILLVLVSFNLHAQILNGGFEQWSMGEPVGWQTNNINEPNLTLTPITQSSFAHGGSYALKGEVLEVPVDGPTITHAPILVSGTLEDPVFSYSGKPEYIRGFYNFQSVGGDGFVANAFLLSGENPIAVSGFTTNNSTGPGYHELIMDFFYVDTVSTPDAIQIFFQISPAPGQTFANVGSTFYIDDFPKMTLIKPEEAPQEIDGEQPVFIAGEVDTIKWNSGGAMNIDIKYSTDNGSTFQNIVSNYPGDSSRYFWAVPGSLLTRKAKIKIVESQNTSNEVKSIDFTIKPWQLTRIDANDELELFEPVHDGWSFGNSKSNMWPQSWWTQFDYQTGIDPYTNIQYPPIPLFMVAPDSTFPDWPLFVEVFGVEQCYYISGENKTYRSSALDWWKNIDGGNWVGSCFGFSATSLAAFYFKDLFLNKYPQIGQYNRIYSLSLNNDRRKVINAFYVGQYELGNLNYRRARKSTVDAQQTLAELKDMLKLENGDARPLAYYNQNGSGGHSVVPYKLVRVGNTSEFELEFYDSENPGSSNQFIEIDSTNNIWIDLAGTNFGSGTTDFFLELPSAYYLAGGPTIPPQSPNLESSSIEEISNSLNGILIFNTSDADIIINSASGGQIGYQDSMEFSNLTDGISIIPLTGTFNPPIGYYLPENNYLLQLNNFSDSLSYVFFLSSSTFYDYSRFDADNNENDLLNYSENGIGISNPDPVNKAVNLETVILVDTTSEKIFLTSNVVLSAGDSIKFKEVNRNNLLLNNFGEGMNYDLHIKFASLNGMDIFEHNSISMAQNSGHQIVPDWNDLHNEPVKILIDLGNDGTIDDSMFVKNQATNVEDEGSLLSPDNYNLAQNYPNPFNPVTTIKYSIPETGNVSLKVYDILGNEVASLVNEEKAPGVYSVTFDALKLSSGVYFYKIQSGSYVETKKMLLLK